MVSHLILLHNVLLLNPFLCTIHYSLIHQMLNYWYHICDIFYSFQDLKNHCIHQNIFLVTHYKILHLVCCYCCFIFWVFSLLNLPKSLTNLARKEYPYLKERLSSFLILRHLQKLWLLLLIKFLLLYSFSDAFFHLYLFFHHLFLYLLLGFMSGCFDFFTNSHFIIDSSKILMGYLMVKLSCSSKIKIVFSIILVKYQVYKLNINVTD